MHPFRWSTFSILRNSICKRPNIIATSSCFEGVANFSVLLDRSSRQETPVPRYFTPLQQSVRGKAINKSRLVGTLGHRRTKIRGIKREDGEWVSAGTLLVRQLGLLYFPGLNVGLSRNRDLFAMDHGTVMITTEKVNPDWNQKIMHMFFGEYANRKDIPIYKTYFHVITDPMPQKFNLIKQV